MSPLTTRHHRQEPDRHPTAPRNPARGSRHGRAKLTEADVRAIRARHVWMCPVNGAKAIAREYGVHLEAIRALLDGRTWRHVSVATEGLPGANNPRKVA